MINPINKRALNKQVMSIEMLIENKTGQVNRFELLFTPLQIVKSAWVALYH